MMMLSPPANDENLQYAVQRVLQEIQRSTLHMQLQKAAQVLVFFQQSSECYFHIAVQYQSYIVSHLIYCHDL